MNKEQDARRQREKYHANKKKRLCTKCSKKLDTERSNILCSVCLEKAKGYVNNSNRNFYYKNRKIISEKNKIKYKKITFLSFSLA